MVSEKRTWCRLEVRQQREASQLPRSWKVPPVTDQELHPWWFTESGSSSPSPTSTPSPIIPSEHTFSICVPFSLTYNDLSFCGALADWVFTGLWIKPTEQLYCIQLMQRLYSTARSHLSSFLTPDMSNRVLPPWLLSAVSLFFKSFFFYVAFFFLLLIFSFLPSLVFISLEHFTASTRACQLHTVVTASAPTTWQRGRQIDRETERLMWNSAAHKKECWTLRSNFESYWANVDKEKQRQGEI